MRCCVAGSLLVALGVCSPLVRAQTTDGDQARVAFEQGQQLADAQRFEEALAAYRESYRLNPSSPSPLAGIGLCLALLGRDQEALEAFDQYLDEGRNPETRQQAEESIRQLLGRLGRGTINVRVSPAGASITVDGEPVPENRPDRVRVPAGEHTITARAQGYAEFSQQVAVAAQQTAQVSIELRPAEPAPPPAEVADRAPGNQGPPEEPRAVRQPVYRRWWFWTIIGVVVVGGVAAGLGVGLQPDEPPAGDWRLQFP